MALACHPHPEPVDGNKKPGCMPDDKSIGCRKKCCTKPNGGGGSRRVGGDYKNVSLEDGAGGATIAFGSGAGPDVNLAYSNLMTVNGNLTDIKSGWGTNWSLNLAGKIHDLGGDIMVAFLLPGSQGEKYYFKRQVDDSYLPLYGSNAVLTESSSEYTMMVDGIKTIFYKPTGYLKQSTSAGGIVTDFIYDSTGVLDEVVTKRNEGSTHIHNSLVFVYQSSGGGGSSSNSGPGSGDSSTIESITQRSYVGTNSSPSDNDYVPQSRLLLDITDSFATDRYLSGSLHKTHFQTPTVSGGVTTWDTDRSSMYIYYTSGSSTSFTGALKYIIEPAGYASLANPDTATNAQLLAASSAYYQYDSDRRVTRIETKGGDEYSTIAYTENTSTPTDPANNWKLKSVYTSNDGSVKTVYASHLGGDMLLDETDGTDHWIYYTKFDSDGRETERYSPAAIDMSGSSYDQQEDDLDVQVNTAAGRVDVTTWYTTTGSAAAEGRLESRKVKKGSSGTAITLAKTEYTSRTVSSQTVYPVSKQIAYQSDTGGGDPVETTFSYTWHSGTLQPATVTTNLPDVPTTENGVGNPQSDTTVAEYNVLGQLIKSTDARGTVTEYDYDSATGAQIQVIRDSGTGKLNLTEDYTVDERGRVTQTLGPAHLVDGVNVRTASWTVRISDLEHWTAQGFQTVANGAYTLINPVSISKKSADGTTVERITAKRGSTVDDVVKSEFDDAVRVTKVIRNSGGTGTETVRTEYNTSGQMSKQIAENADTGNQETVYTYRVTTTDSDLASNQLLEKVTHPDTGTVTYDYDRTGQQTSMTDANGSVHDYSYDDAGRRVTDKVSTLGSGVDGAVRRIEHSYDNRMRLENVTSYDATTAGNVQSDIQFAYNDFGQVTSEYQQHGSAVSVSTSPVTEYDYANGSANTIRMTSMTYPDGRQLDYGYGTSGSESDLLDRVVTIKDGATTLVTYEYSGAGSVVTQTYNEPGIEKTLNLGSGSNPYSALDRFGRMIDLRWKKSAADLVRFEYDYDRVSNRLNERNKVSTGSNPDVDGLFGFGELNRLTSFKTGLLNTGGDAISSPEMTQSFTLDETGNFKGFTQTVVDALTQTRTHNKVNELTNITETVGAAWATPAHDNAGNMTSIPQPSALTTGYDATWDAWHRLVKLSASSSTVAEYEYDGANRRTIKKVYVSGSLDETRHVYYTTQSQAIEERVDSSSDAEIQFVWNLGYVDDLVLRDRDTTSDGTLDERLYSLPDLRYSVMALASSTGTIVERFKYNAHGHVSVLDSLFASRSSSSYDWEFRYTGRREDLETGLYFFRARFYHAQLGRFISRDPLGFVDGMSLYRAYFVPSGVDPSGTDAFDDLVNFSSGVNDSLTMGIHGWVRGLIGINDGVDVESGWYVAGEVTEIVIETGLTLGAGASRHVARRTVRSTLEGGARSAYRRKYKIEGGIIHHANPIKGHIGGVPSYFPLPYKFAARGRWNFQYLSNVGEHAAMHRRLRRQEQMLKRYNFTQPVRNAGNLIIQHGSR